VKKEGKGGKGKNRTDCENGRPIFDKKTSTHRNNNNNKNDNNDNKG
jgi:hypothetical protein